MTHGLKPPSGMSAFISDFNPGTSLVLRKPKNVPLPSLSLCACLEETNGSVQGNLVCFCGGDGGCVVHADTDVNRMDSNNKSNVGNDTILVVL